MRKLTIAILAGLAIAAFSAPTFAYDAPGKSESSHGKGGKAAGIQGSNGKGNGNAGTPSGGGNSGSDGV
jgi:hypothetical protein